MLNLFEGCCKGAALAEVAFEFDVAAEPMGQLLASRQAQAAGFDAARRRRVHRRERKSQDLTPGQAPGQKPYGSVI
jgi:hypothetical protein